MLKLQKGYGLWHGLIMSAPSWSGGVSSISSPIATQETSLLFESAGALLGRHENKETHLRKIQGPPQNCWTSRNPQILRDAGFAVKLGPTGRIFSKLAQSFGVKSMAKNLALHSVASLNLDHDFFQGAQAFHKILHGIFHLVNVWTILKWLLTQCASNTKLHGETSSKTNAWTNAGRKQKQKHMDFLPTPGRTWTRVELVALKHAKHSKLHKVKQLLLAAAGVRPHQVEDFPTFRWEFAWKVVFDAKKSILLGDLKQLQILNLQAKNDGFSISENCWTCAFFSKQKAIAVKRSITPLGHFRRIANHFWETVFGIAGANHLKEA